MRLFVPSLIFGTLTLIPASRVDARDVTWLDDAIAQKARKAVVTVLTTSGASATGFFVSADGWVVTTAGAMEGQRAVKLVTEAQQNVNEAKLIAIDPEYDLAVLATRINAPAFLNVRASPAGFCDPCVLPYSDGSSIKVVDGVMLYRRSGLDWSGTHFHPLWTLMVPPSPALTGAPLVTKDGCVAGIFNFVNGAGSYTLNFAVPESAVREVLDKANKATGPIPFPKKGEINPDMVVETDLDYIAGMSMVAQGDVRGAREKFRATLKRHSKAALVLTQMAWASLSIGEIAEGEKLLRQAVTIAPNKLMTQVQLGDVIRDKGQREEAILHFRQVVKQCPELPQAWAALAKVLIESGQKAEGLEAARKWTELQPESFSAWDSYALALSGAGDQKEASRARQRSAELESLLFKIRYKSVRNK